MRRIIPPMLRALWLGLAMLGAAGPAQAAGDIDTCRNSTAEPAERLTACESVIADENDHRHLPRRRLLVSRRHPGEEARL